MRTPPSLLPVLAFAFQTAMLPAAEQIVCLGDSLTFAYEASFRFQQTITVSPPFTTTVGDGMPATVKNWIEILQDPAYRGDRFDLGARDSLTVDPPYDPPFSVHFRQAHNWAIPGLKVDQLRQFLYGETDFNTMINTAPEFSTLATLISYSDFNQTTDFNLTDLENQIQNTAERLTVFIGGNDLRAIYGTVYDGGSAGTFVADFIADMTAILSRIQTLKPGIQIVLVNVPHIGITLDVREDYPYDVVKTERVSAVVRDLNGQLATLAASKGIGYADVCTPTLPLIVPDKGLWIHGYNFGTQQGANTGQLGRVWLDGSLSNKFHPNTNGQAVIANEIIHAFNKRYNTSIARLSATEVLSNLCARQPSDVDKTYNNWVSAALDTVVPVTDDSDGDGIPSGAEFALGLNPSLKDADRLSSGRVGAELELAYPTRLPTSTRYTLAPESASSPAGPYTPVSPPAVAADGLIHARIPIGAGPGFLRLKAVVNP